MTRGRKILAVAGAGLALALAACGGTAAPAPATPQPPSPASIAARLGCQVSGPSISAQDAYDTVAYDALSATGDPSSPCYVQPPPDVSEGIASDVITFASQAKETDWLHQNDLAQAGGAVTGSGYVGLVEGNMWVVTSGSGVVGLDNIAAKLGGKAVTTF
jgi:hypothetical protein